MGQVNVLYCHGEFLSSSKPETTSTSAVNEVKAESIDSVPLEEKWLPNVDLSELTPEQRELTESMLTD